MDADAELNAFFVGYIAVARPHATLHFESTANGIDDTRKLDQDAVASRLDDPATVRGNRGVDQLVPQRTEARNRVLLVHPGQAAIPRHISSQDRCKPSFDTLLLHGSPRRVVLQEHSTT